MTIYLQRKKKTHFLNHVITLEIPTSLHILDVRYVVQPVRWDLRDNCFACVKVTATRDHTNMCVCAMWLIPDARIFIESTCCGISWNILRSYQKLLRDGVETLHANRILSVVLRISISKLFYIFRCRNTILFLSRIVKKNVWCVGTHVFICVHTK